MSTFLKLFVFSYLFYVSVHSTRQRLFTVCNGLYEKTLDMQEYHCCAVQIKKQNKNNGKVIVLFKSQSYEKEVHTVMVNNSTFKQ